MEEKHWSDFVENYYQPIYGYCYQFLGSHAEAEDAVQQAFLKAYKKRSKLRNQTQLKSWVYSIARNVCIDRLRWWKRTRLVVAQLETPEINENNELVMTIKKLLARLPARQREVFILRHWHGFSTEEAAELLGISTGSVKSHLKRAIDKLKKELKTSEVVDSMTTKVEAESS
ncbi:MAG: RNA polymerase sigma factor [Candidatus Dadabacteria bacterium]|nr:MAG: RNA polymerase sigma factor [Candidatus Dadabacteria bacterium]